MSCWRVQVKQGTKDDHHEQRYREEFEPLKDVFALGDCCANVKAPLPSLAQVCTTAVACPTSIAITLLTAVHGPHGCRTHDLDTASAARCLPLVGRAQVAEQQGKYLAKQLNTSAKAQPRGQAAT